MGTCFTTLVPRYESPPTRGWFSATLEYSNLSSTPPRLGRNPSRLRKHFDRLSWRSTGRCRTNVPFSRALLVKQHQNGTTGREMAMRATRGVIARIKMLMERNERWCFQPWYAKSLGTRNGTDAPDRNRDQPRTDWVQKTLYESGASFLPPLLLLLARSLGPPLLTICYTVSPVVLAQTVYSLLHASYSCLERTI